MNALPTLPRLMLVIALLAALLAGSAACHPAADRQCTRKSDCPDGDFCRFGACVPAIGKSGPPRPDTRPDSAAGWSAEDTDIVSDAALGSDSAADVADTGPAVPLQCEGARAPAPGDLVINELLADPPDGLAGDTNGDGVRDASDDEFIEIVDVSNTPIYLSRITIRVGGEVAFEFPPSCLPPGGSAVVWGGYLQGGADQPDRPGGPAGMVGFVAPSRLGLTNGGGRAALVSAAGETLDVVRWSSGPSESLTRTPQIEGPDFAPHSELVEDRLHSPGLCADGSPTKGGCPTP